MLRRLECYRIPADVPRERVDALETALRDCARYIPEVLCSALGHNRSDAAVDLVWEHAYADAAAYQRYMHHPFHISRLDDFLSPDDPGCITGEVEPGTGLIGYPVDGAVRFAADSGVRRLLALRVEPAAARTLLERLAGAADAVPGMRLSVVGVNEMGEEWFPGVWTHIWEQVFDDDAGLRAYLDGDSELIRAERTGLPGVTAHCELYWTIEPAGAA